MRIGHVLALSATLLIAGACKPEAPAPATTPAAPASAVSTPAPARPAAPTRDAVFGNPQLDQMLAPVALYPDVLLAQVLMAATYPGDVADAVAWSRAHPDAKGEHAVRQVAGQPWDASVQTLVAFPQALAMLGQDLGWVQRLGDAFLAQPEDVMASVQRLRRKAQQTGHLRSNEYQLVATGGRPASRTAPADEPYDDGVADTYEPAADDGYGSYISIAPIDEVYVPSYDPMDVYDPWEDEYYLPVYYPPLAGYYPGGVLAKGIAFGIGVAVIDALWGEIDWNGGDIDIDFDRYDRVYPDHHFAGGDRTWRHDPVSRDGVPYRDRVNRERYGQQLAGAQARDAFRGDDAQRMASREQARRSLQQGGFQAPSTNNREARENALAAQLEESNARERAMAVAQADQREREARLRGDEGVGMPGRDGVGQDGIADRAQQIDRERALEQERVREIAHERRLNEEQRARREYEDRRARENAFEGVRQAELARAQHERGIASQAQRQQGSGGGGRAVSRPSRR